MNPTVTSTSSSTNGSTFSFSLSPTSDVGSEISELEAERQKLAPEALSGDAAALKRIKEIESDLSDKRRAVELQQLALTENQRREAEEERRRRENEIRKLKIKLGNALRKRRSLGEQFDKAVETLCEAAKAIKDNGREAENLSMDLGYGRGRYRDALAVSYLQWRLHEVWPGDFPRPDAKLRTPLSEAWNRSFPKEHLTTTKKEASNAETES